MLAISSSSVRAQPAELDKDGQKIHPLALKEEMIRDRFQRFEDRIYRLREQLADAEPDNAAKLARVLQRAGELGLADQLDDLIEMLKSPSTLPGAPKAQAGWLADADRLLAILVERDSDNQERREEIERLEEYNEKIADLLAREQALRSATGQGNLAERMLSQLNESIRRIDALMKRQQALSEQSAQGAGKPSSGEGQGEQLAEKQDVLSQDTKQLAEDLERLADLKPEAKRDSPELEAAREKTKAAAQSAQKGSGKMSGAGEQMQQPGGGSPSEQQEQAQKALEEAREQLEQAKRELEKSPDSQEQAEQQEKIAQETGELSQQMQQEGGSQEGGQSSEQSQQGSPSSSPGQQSVQKAQQEMNKAAQSMKESKGDEAGESQDQAIEQLEQAKKELEEALAQLRQEEREEVLRDLEVRFRKMLAGQRGVNDGTLQLDQLGSDNFARAQHLRLAELSAKQRDLATDAEVCGHILEEDGSTIVFPRMLEQLGEDMTTVALRLAAFKVASLTQTIEGEIIDTLEQLLEALQQMQQENEQQGGQPQEGEPKDSPLLPPSAELKLLRAAQMRVNTRTGAIAVAREEKSDTEASLAETLRGVAIRQRECGSIAEEMRASQQSP